MIFCEYFGKDVKHWLMGQFHELYCNFADSVNGMSRNKKEYEVRSNLKNFTEDENAELYCIRYHVVQVGETTTVNNVSVC